MTLSKKTIYLIIAASAITLLGARFFVSALAQNPDRDRTGAYPAADNNAPAPEKTPAALRDTGLLQTRTPVQDADGGGAAPAKVPESDLHIGVPGTNAESSGYLFSLRQAQSVMKQRIDPAMKRLRGATSDDEKQAALAELRAVLAAIFDQDMQAREKQVREIESRIQRLRQQYQERTREKDQIIELQLKVLENEAAGLGFPYASPDESPGKASDYEKPDQATPESGPWPDARIRPQEGSTPEAVRTGAGRFPWWETLQDNYRNSARAQELAGALLRKGHFVLSPDSKCYAYVFEATALGEARAEIRLCDSHTGKVLATAKVARPVGQLEFFNEGVATRDPDGTLKLRISLSKDHDTQDVSQSVLPSQAETDGATTDESASALTPDAIRQMRDNVISQLQGTWHCVAAWADGKEYDPKEALYWELQCKFQGDKVTVSYIGADLQRVETTGKLTLDLKANPPRFFIEVKLTDWKEPSRLSGAALVDRGRLRLVNQGYPITLGRNLDPAPAVFWFQRLSDAIDPRSGINESD